jgi:hypothetical protein
MANNRNRRVADLENRSGGQSAIVMDWGDDRLMVNGVEITRAEFEKRYPDAVTVTWDDDYEKE